MVDCVPNAYSLSQLGVAIIGAGLSGLTLARALRQNGVRVSVFDKGRGVAGRMSTRRTPGYLQFDHGAQYFTVRDRRFQTAVAGWKAEGFVAEWRGRIGSLSKGDFSPRKQRQPLFVGVPGMSSLCKYLAHGLDVRSGCTVAPPVRTKRGNWGLSEANGEPLGEYDWVISSAPAPQSAELLSTSSELCDKARSAPMSGCLAAMVAFEDRLEFPFDGAFVENSPLSWVARNSSKPGRTGPADCWVLHALPEWSDRRIKDRSKDPLPELLDGFWKATGDRPRKPAFAVSHMWRFALPTDPLPEGCLVDPDLRLGACGDWCGGPRVEGAYLSGLSMAERLVDSAQVSV